MDFNISATGMKTALEAIPSINTVSVHRELYCDRETGALESQTCAEDRGYVWMITFVDVIENVTFK